MRERLQKIFSASGVCSRRQAEEALRQSHSQAQFRANQAMLARAMARLRNSRSNINLDS